MAKYLFVVGIYTLGFVLGYLTRCWSNKNKLKEIVKEYEKQGDENMEYSLNNKEIENSHFWDGFKSCAENILRDL